VSEFVSTMTAREMASQASDAIRALRHLATETCELTDPREVGDVIAALEQLGESLPHLCEHLARFLVAGHEDRQIVDDDDGVSVEVAAEALSAAGQAADMLSAALTEARAAAQGIHRPA
jgi:hypothetical protein